MFFDLLKKAGNFLTDLVFPRRCPFCDEIVTPYGEKIHAKCIKKLRLLTPPYCLKCGKKLMGEDRYCTECASGKHKFLRGRCLYEYDSAAKSIYRFKYGKRPEYAEYYGEEIADYLGDFIRDLKPDAIVPIPIHRKRYAKRGYNQAALLAKEVSKNTGIPYLEGVVKRRRNTAPLKMLSPQERQKNLKNAFIVGENVVKLKTIILIDDIYTTGATVDEVTKFLHKAGIPDVYFVALAGGESI